MSETRTIVVGHGGQDGRLLVELLRGRGDRIIGIGREGVRVLAGEFAAAPTTIGDGAGLERVVADFQPGEIYYLAAHHRSSQERQGGAEGIGRDIESAMDVNVTGLLNCLEAMRRCAPACRLFYASSSLIFGQRGAGERQDEETAPTPVCEYGLTKLLGGLACRRYRSQAGLFACVGILYNHESALRSPEFVTRKIIDAALRIKAGSKEKLRLAQLNAMVDWGYAPDYVKAFTRILALDQADDFVIARGAGHTIEEFVAIAFSHLGLDWRQHVELDPSILGRAPSCRIGNPEKLNRVTGWKASLSFPEMVRTLVQDVAAQRGLS